MTYYDHAVAITYGLSPWAGSHASNRSTPTYQKEAEISEARQRPAAHPEFVGFAGRLRWLLGR